MGELARTVLEAGGAVTGVIPRQLVDKELPAPYGVRPFPACFSKSLILLWYARGDSDPKPSAPEADALSS